MLYWLEAGASEQKLRRATTTVLNPPVALLPPTIATYGGLAFSPQGIVDAAGQRARDRVRARAPHALALGRPDALRVHPAARRARPPARLRRAGPRGRDRRHGDYPAGRHAATWDRTTNAGPAPAGVYFLRLEAPGVALTQRCVLLP